jgi:hypothetical protein
MRAAIVQQEVHETSRTGSLVPPTALPGVRRWRDAADHVTCAEQLHDVDESDPSCRTNSAVRAACASRCAACASITSGSPAFAARSRSTDRSARDGDDPDRMITGSHGKIKLGAVTSSLGSPSYWIDTYRPT